MSENACAHVLALDHHPELAREVGLILSAFAILELSPEKILAKLTRLAESEAQILSSQFKSFGARIEALEALLRSRSPDDPDIIVANNLVSRLKKCASIRNKYAHGLWTEVTTENGSAVRLTGWLPDSRKTVASLVTVASLRDDCAYLRQTLHLTIDYAWIVVPDVEVR